jgi:hypothetical protein
MDFGEIPPEAEAQRPWLKKINIGPPRDDEAGVIGSLPALMGNEVKEGIGEIGVIRICATPSSDDLLRLQAGEKIWIEIWSSVMYPIAIEVGKT